MDYEDVVPGQRVKISRRAIKTELVGRTGTVTSIGSETDIYVALDGLGTTGFFPESLELAHDEVTAEELQAVYRSLGVRDVGQ